METEREKEKVRGVVGGKKKEEQGRRNAPSHLAPPPHPPPPRDEHSNALHQPRSLATPLLVTGTLLGVPRDTTLTIPPPKRRREIDAKGGEAAGRSSIEEEEEGEGEEGEGRDHGDAGGDPRSRASLWPAWPALAAPDDDRAGNLTQPASSDSGAERVAPASAGEAAAWRNGHRFCCCCCEAAAEFVITAFAFAPTSGTTPPSPWKNE